jgi:hypothetical protein
LIVESFMASRLRAQAFERTRKNSPAPAAIETAVTPRGIREGRVAETAR